MGGGGDFQGRFENLEYLFICGLSGFPGVIFQELPVVVVFSLLSLSPFLLLKQHHCKCCVHRNTIRRDVQKRASEGYQRNTVIYTLLVCVYFWL